MKSNGQTAIVFVALAAACSLCLMVASSTAQATHPELKPAIAPMGYFLGVWDCSGKFDSSGKTIEAHQQFASDLDGGWITFRHDDKPPFAYHALAEWGWDAARKEFIMIAQDSTGGVRVFRSSGWNSTQLQWDGDTLGSSSTPTQRFTFERLDDRHFKVSYFTLKGGDWSRMDSSTCSKQ